MERRYRLCCSQFGGESTVRVAASPPLFKGCGAGVLLCPHLTLNLQSQGSRCCLASGSLEYFGADTARKVAIDDQATMWQVAPMTLNLQKQRGISSKVFSDMIWHYPK